MRETKCFICKHGTIDVDKSPCCFCLYGNNFKYKEETKMSRIVMKPEVQNPEKPKTLADINHLESKEGEFFVVERVGIACLVHKTEGVWYRIHPEGFIKILEGIELGHFKIIKHIENLTFDFSKL